MKRLLCFFLVLSCLAAAGQQELKGVVLGENDQPIASASVFLSNTSVGTIADGSGRFTLQLPQGRFDLIVTSVGYETWSRTVGTGPEGFLTVRLKLKAPELETVVIEPFEKNGWERWGRFFLENFIGTSDFASDCKLKNPEVLRFRHSRKNGVLTATALEPLIIENKALGYTIRYQLETFRFDFSSRYLIFTGYPFFEPMAGNESRQRRWEKRRQETYEGSMLHYMRSLYRNRLAQEGFEVRRLFKVKRPIKTTGNFYSSRPASDAPITLKPAGGMEPGYELVDSIGQEVLPGDSIAYAIDSVTAGHEFSHYLLVSYLRKEVPKAYSSLYPRSGTVMRSQLTLVNGRPVSVQANGVYYEPADLLTMGFWAWWEKIATMLPFDYRPPSPSRQ
jgi:hypothetical protein